MSDRYTIDPADEMLVLMTKTGKAIGQARREDCHKGKGKTHWGVLGVIKRSDGRIILAKRSRHKSVFANMWDGSVATHVLVGDRPEQAAVRETREELGISVRFEPIGNFFYQARDGDHAENEYCTVLLGTSDKPLKPLTQEVSQTQELTFAELVNRLQTMPGKYSPWMILAFQKFAAKIKSA